MSFQNNLKEILLQQKLQIELLEKEIIAFESVDYIQNNEQLKKELNEALLNRDETNSINKKLSDENSSLKSALSSQIYSQKLSFINISKNHTAKLYADFVDGEEKRLTQVEKDYRSKLENIRQNITAHSLSSDLQLQEGIMHIESILTRKIEENRYVMLKSAETINDEIAVHLLSP